MVSNHCNNDGRNMWTPFSHNLWTQLGQLLNISVDSPTNIQMCVGTCTYVVIDTSQPRYAHIHGHRQRKRDRQTDKNIAMWMHSHIYLDNYVFAHTHTLYIYIYIYIMSCRQHRYPWPSRAASPYRSSLLSGHQGYIPIAKEMLYVCSSWPSCFYSAICGGP